MINPDKKSKYLLFANIFFEFSIQKKYFRLNFYKCRVPLLPYKILLIKKKRSAGCVSPSVSHCNLVVVVVVGGVSCSMYSST